MLYLVFLFSIIFAGLAWQRPVLAMQLTLFALPAYLIRFKLGVPMTLLEVMILINFAAWFIKEWRGLFLGIQNRFKKTEARVIEYPFALEMMAILILSFVAVGVSHFSNEAMGTWKAYFFEPLLFLILVYNIFGKMEGVLSERLTKIIWPLACSALAVGLLAAYQKLTGNLIDNPLWAAASTRRVVSVFGYPNAVGLYVESIIFLTFGLFFVILSGAKRSEESLSNKLEGKKLLKILHFVQDDKIKIFILLCSFILSLLSILFAKSNGAALGLAAGFSLFAILYSKQSRKAFLIGFLAAALIVLAIPSGRSKATEYLLLQDFSGQVRLIGWQETWRMLSNGRLLTGAGLSNFQNTVAPYHVPGFYFNKNHDPDFHRKLVIFDQKYRDQFWQPLEVYMYPHNIFLNFWSELGLLGLLAFAWLIGRVLYFGFWILDFGFKDKAERFILLGALAALTATVVHGMVDVPYFKNDLAILFWLLVGIVGLFQLNTNTCVIPGEPGEGRESRKK